jgi:hypothetical protein
LAIRPASAGAHKNNTEETHMNKPEFLSSGTKAPFSARYENFIGGQWVAPVAGR